MLRAEGDAGELTRTAGKGHLGVQERGLTVTQGKMTSMPASPPPGWDLMDPGVATYATAAQQRAYIAAMKRIREGRRAGDPVRVYICAAPHIARRVQWEQRLAKIAHRLPGAELLQFDDLFTPENYADKWRQEAAGFDGMVVVGSTKRGANGHVYRLGETARLEVIDMVKAGKPVLLHAKGLGLIPFVDCKIHRVGGQRLRTKITVPDDWNPADYEPTLRAALRALRPRIPEAATTKDAPPHLVHPFAAPSR
jgi:hypothetical protein